jgi:hypothetical protein
LARENTLSKAKASIIEVLESCGAGISVDELLRELDGRGVDDAAQIKAAVWALISESTVELTPEYLLKMAARVCTAT